MKVWDQPLSRENFDAFYNAFTAPAYKSAYKILGDTTRTEKVLIDSFVTLFQKRKDVDPDELAFLFGNILQEKIQIQTEKYFVRETEVPNRNLDEFTRNSLLAEIHRQLDSVPFRVMEKINSATGKKDEKKGARSFQIQFLQDMGLNVVYILQLLVVALIISLVTTLSAGMFIDTDQWIPEATDSAIPIADEIVKTMSYYPVLLDLE